MPSMPMPSSRPPAGVSPSTRMRPKHSPAGDRRRGGSCRRDRPGAAADVQSACRRCCGAARRSARSPRFTRGRGGARRHAARTTSRSGSAAGKRPLRCWTISRPGSTTRQSRAELASQTVPMLLFAGEVEESNARAGALIGDSRVAAGRPPSRSHHAGRGVRGDGAAGDRATRSCTSRSRPSVTVSKDCRWRRASRGRAGARVAVDR